MAALVIGDSQVRLIFPNENRLLSGIQVASPSLRWWQRLSTSLCLAMTRRAGDSAGYWIDPSVPLIFDYDLEDETGEPIPPVDVREQDGKVLLEAMDRSSGILWGFDQDTRPPFWEASSDSGYTAPEDAQGQLSDRRPASTGRGSTKAHNIRALCATVVVGAHPGPTGTYPSPTKPSLTGWWQWNCHDFCRGSIQPLSVRRSLMARS